MADKNPPTSATSANALVICPPGRFLRVSLERTMPVPLTTHLVSLSTPRPYSAATEHPFLTAAGTGTLSIHLISLYLSQDRIYAAHAYPRFIGHLITRIPFSSLDAPDGPAEQLNRDILGLLADALHNVRREVDLFEQVDKTYGLRCAQWGERKATRDYTAEMARISAFGSVEDGLVFLWAMERVYLDSWTYVKSLLPHVEGDGSPALPIIKQLVDNWTTPAFQQFVDAIAGLVNRMNIMPGTAAFIRAEQIWAQVVELEESFWPVTGEELERPVVEVERD